MNEKLDLILNELEKANSTLNRHEEMLVQLIKITGSNNAKLDGLISSQERQERILEMLSKRSIEQEADINDLKRIHK